MNTLTTFPPYAKFVIITIGVFALITGMYLGQHIIVPIIYATIIAILLNPLVNGLVRHKTNRILAISLAVITAIIVLIILLYFISTQLSLLRDTYPKLKDKFLETSSSAVIWTSNHLNIKSSNIHTWIENNKTEAINNMGGTIGQTFSAINGVIVILVLLPVYLFMILYYKNLFIEFIRRLFSTTHHEVVFNVMLRSKNIIQSYLAGLLVEAAIIATLNSLGLLLLGIDYAIILGVTGALLNIIPYIGGVIALALPMLVAYITKESSTYALLVLVVYSLIQFIDNHFIIPHIVASRVKLNALISIIAVLAGNALWGIPGMFLSIPLTAILKVIFDHIEFLKPWGYLLGNVVPTSRLNFDFIKLKFKK